MKLIQIAAAVMIDRIVHLIETQSHHLTSQVVERLRDSFVTPKYENVPPEELRRSVYEVYRHLGNWLLTKNEPDLARWFLRTGSERARQNVPFSQVVAATVLIKVTLCEAFKNGEAEERVGKAYDDVQTLQMLGEFFDRVIYYLAVGYERRSPRSKDDKKAA